MVATTKPQQKVTAKINISRKAKKHSKPLSIEKQLEALQYSTQQIAKIKACKSSSKTLLFLMKNHVSLEKLGYTTDQLAKIAANHGSSCSLESLLSVMTLH